MKASMQIIPRPPLGVGVELVTAPRALELLAARRDIGPDRAPMALWTLLSLNLLRSVLVAPDLDGGISIRRWRELDGTAWERWFAHPMAAWPVVPPGGEMSLADYTHTMEAHRLAREEAERDQAVLWTLGRFVIRAADGPVDHGVVYVVAEDVEALTPAQIRKAVRRGPPRPPWRLALDAWAEEQFREGLPPIDADSFIDWAVENKVLARIERDPNSFIDPGIANPDHNTIPRGSIGKRVSELAKKYWPNVQVSQK